MYILIHFPNGLIQKEKLCRMKDVKKGPEHFILHTVEKQTAWENVFSLDITVNVLKIRTLKRLTK